MRMVVLPLPRRPKKMYVVSAGAVRSMHLRSQANLMRAGPSACATQSGALSQKVPSAFSPPAPQQRTRGLEALQVGVHVQRHVIQLRLLRGAVHKRVAAPAARWRVWQGQHASFLGRQGPQRCGTSWVESHCTPYCITQSATGHSQAKVLEQVGLAAAASGAAGARRHPGARCR